MKINSATYTMIAKKNRSRCIYIGLYDGLAEFQYGDSLIKFEPKPGQLKKIKKLRQGQVVLLGLPI